jgi:chromosome segregation ATPase
MAIGTVISVFAKIPWGQVVEAAPKVAEVATRLWEAVKNGRMSKPAEAQTGTSQAQPTGTDTVGAHFSELEGIVQDLQEQMQSTAEVVKALADQNAILVQRIELDGARLSELDGQMQSTAGAVKVLDEQYARLGQRIELDKARISELDGIAQGLQEQMQSTSEVVKTLADQISLLVQRIELNGRRLVVFAVAGSVCIAILASAVIYLLAAR